MPRLALVALAILGACSTDAGLPVDAATELDGALPFDASPPFDATMPRDLPPVACGDMTCGANQVCQHLVCNTCVAPVDGECPPGSAQAEGTMGPPFCGDYGSDAGIACWGPVQDVVPPRCVDIPSTCPDAPCNCMGLCADPNCRQCDLWCF